MLPRRFYATAATAAEAGGYAVRLDDKPVRTPARRMLAAPTLALAEAIAAEWQAQKDVIGPAKMPLTRLANAIIDGVADAPLLVADEIAKYLASDLLFYLAPSRRRGWSSARRSIGIRSSPGRGRRSAPISSWAKGSSMSRSPRPRLPPLAPRSLLAVAVGALHAVTTLTGSALIALAMARGALSADAAWQAAHVDEDWNMAKWGCDEMARRPGR